MFELSDAIISYFSEFTDLSKTHIFLLLFTYTAITMTIHSAIHSSYNPLNALILIQQIGNVTIHEKEEKVNCRFVLFHLSRSFAVVSFLFISLEVCDANSLLYRFEYFVCLVWFSCSNFSIYFESIYLSTSKVMTAH